MTFRNLFDFLCVFFFYLRLPCVLIEISSQQLKQLKSSPHGKAGHGLRCPLSITRLYLKFAFLDSFNPFLLFTYNR